MIFIKGLIEKKTLIRNIIVMGVIIFLYVLISQVLSLVEKYENDYENQEEFRTITTTSQEINRYLKEYEDSIERYIETEAEYQIVFKTKLDLDNFYQKEKNTITDFIISVPSDTQTGIQLKILKVSIFIINVFLIILNFIFLIDYINKIQSEIILYLFLGYPLKIIKLFLFIVFWIIYSLEYIISLLLFSFEIKITASINCLFIVVLGLTIIIGINFINIKKFRKNDM